MTHGRLAEDENNISLGNWAKTMNKSAVVSKKSTSFGLNEKLIKMREKVKRERSANAE